MKTKLTQKQKNQYKQIVKDIIIFTMLLISCVSCSSTYAVTVKQSQPEQEQHTEITTTTTINGLKY